MHRFYIEPGDINHHQGTVRIAGDEVRHIVKVLRFGAGDEIVAFDGEGNEYLLELEQQDHQWQGRIVKVDQPSREARSHLVLVQGLAKADRMDTIVQKAVEIGIAEIYPVVTRNSVVRLDDGKKGSKADRWQSIAREACKQSRRVVVPQVHTPMPLSDFWQGCSQYGDGCCFLMAYENAPPSRLRGILQDIRNEPPQKIYLIIGPEGGFDHSEAQQAERQGCQTFGLGPRILRTETAGVAVASIILYELGDLA